ncbi:MAG: ABC-2 family transporter protein [Spirochaetes bacterium]|nr:ABC-2 family transporter protein [Spirochaetota bacterium]
MSNTLKHYLSVALCSTRLAIQRQFEYPIFLVSWVIINPLQYFSGVWLLKVLADRFHNLAGWNFPQIAFVYGLGLLSHGLQVVFFIQTWNMERFVVKGEFDRMLVRPMNVFFQFIIRNINLVGFTDMIPGTVIFLYASKQIGFVWNICNIISIIAVLIGGMLIRASIYTIFSSVAFWTYRSRSLITIVYNMMERGTLYPLSIYPRLFQLFFTFIIPIAFISFYPACDFLGQSDRTSLPLGLVVWTPVVGIIIFWVAIGIFRFGLKNYESAGT